jgi:hypothetical protein
VPTAVPVTSRDSPQTFASYRGQPALPAPLRRARVQPSSIPDSVHDRPLDVAIVYMVLGAARAEKDLSAKPSNGYADATKSTLLLF